MKNVFKKIAATAMTFALLGTGSVLSNNIAPNSDNTLVASAATYCPAHNGVVIDYYEDFGYCEPGKLGRICKRYKVTYCAVCHKKLSTEWEYVWHLL